MRRVADKGLGGGGVESQALCITLSQLPKKETRAKPRSQPQPQHKEEEHSQSGRNQELADNSKQIDSTCSLEIIYATAALG